MAEHLIPDPTATRLSTDVQSPEAVTGNAGGWKVGFLRAGRESMAAVVRASVEEKWLRENRAAIGEYNRHVEECGFVLAGFRRF